MTLFRNMERKSDRVFGFVYDGTQASLDALVAEIGPVPDHFNLNVERIDEDTFRFNSDPIGQEFWITGDRDALLVVTVEVHGNVGAGIYPSRAEAEVDFDIS
jgi:hypothetical protein